MRESSEPQPDITVSASTASFKQETIDKKNPDHLRELLDIQRKKVIESWEELAAPLFDPTDTEEREQQLSKFFIALNINRLMKDPSSDLDQKLWDKLLAEVAEDAKLAPLLDQWRVGLLIDSNQTPNENPDKIPESEIEQRKNFLDQISTMSKKVFQSRRHNTKREEAPKMDKLLLLKFWGEFIRPFIQIRAEKITDRYEKFIPKINRSREAVLNSISPSDKTKFRRVQQIPILIQDEYISPESSGYRYQAYEIIISGHHSLQPNAAAHIIDHEFVHVASGHDLTKRGSRIGVRSREELIWLNESITEERSWKVSEGHYETGMHDYKICRQMKELLTKKLILDQKDLDTWYDTEGIDATITASLSEKYPSLFPMIRAIEMKRQELCRKSQYASPDLLPEFFGPSHVQEMMAFIEDYKLL